MDLDVAVVGGGPAGTCAALELARRGRKVRLFESDGYDRPRYGETLPPEINPLLEQLGLRREFEAMSPVESPGIISVWGAQEGYEQDFIRNAHGPGWHVDRARFDEMLCRAAERSGAEVSLGTRVTDARPEPGRGWTLTTRNGSGSKRWNARVVVDASGRRKRPVCGSPRRRLDDALVAVAARFARADCDRDDRTYLEAVPAGWWYSAPVPRREMVVMFFTDLEQYRGPGVVVREHLAGAPWTCKRVAGARLIETRVLYAPSATREHVCGPGWLAVGDAASSFDPLSGYGIVRAVAGAVEGAAAAQNLLEGDLAASDSYEGWVASAFSVYADRRRTYYESERRWPAAEFWQRRRGAAARGT